MVSLIKPYELRGSDDHLKDRGISPNLWWALTAARSGELAVLEGLIKHEPALLDAQFWYVSPLHFAVREGHVDVVERLIDLGADYTVTTIFGNRSLLDIARDRNHGDVCALLEQYWKTSMESTGGTEPIHELVRSGDIEGVNALLTQDPDLVNIGDSKGRRPLHCAIEVGNTDLVKILIENGADVDSTGFSSDDRLGTFGFSPLASALWQHAYWNKRQDSQELVRLLLDAEAQYTITIAAALGDLEAVVNFLKSDRSLANDQDSSGKRPLSAAAERGNSEVVETLLQYGADPNLDEGPNCPQGFALWAAARYGHRDILELLLDAGANPNADVESSGTPTTSAKDEATRELLQRYGGQIGLEALSHYGDLEGIKSFVKRMQTKPDTPPGISEMGATFIYTHAVMSNHAHVIDYMLNETQIRVPDTVTYCQSYLFSKKHHTQALLEHGMDANLPSWQRITPLHYCAFKNDIDGAKLFLEFGADVNAVDEEFRTTPLGWAALFGHEEMVRLLIDHDRNLPTQLSNSVPSWSTPQQWAKRRGNERIAQLLDAA